MIDKNDWPPKRPFGLGDINGAVPDTVLLARMAIGRVKPGDVGITVRSGLSGAATETTPEGQLYRMLRKSKEESGE